MHKLLEQINQPNDIKKIDPSDYKRLAHEIRKFLITRISKTGGHLSSNLGVVELTMALHLCLDLPKDKIVWDVGHQAYTHKVLTGRKDGFETLRKYEGMSGFPKRCESDCDSFDTGHSSTSISAALGLAQARDIKGEDQKIVAVIGDGALSGGMAYEALNNAARLKSNLVIVLNDNDMSINKNVGGMSNYLGKIRTSEKYHLLKSDVESTLLKLPKIGERLVKQVRKSKDSIKRLVIPGMLFEDMGITYIGPIDGHNIEELTNALHNAMKVNEAVLVHVNTKKGKGYSIAEKDPSTYHGIEPFNIKTGEVNQKSEYETYTKVFSNTLLELAKEQENIVAITAAMPSGTGLIPFEKKYPNRFFDVGIAEEHAVTFAAGLAAGGMKPFVVVYSTFLQRAYDQIIHDVCIGKFPVVIAIDRAGIVGNDGETHQGIFDISFLMTIPNLTMIAPKNKYELEDMLRFCAQYDAPIAIRYPRGKASLCMEENREPIIYGKSEVLFEEQDILLLAVGSMVETACGVRELLKEYGLFATVVNMRFIKPFDEETINRLAPTHNVIVTLEENVVTGGFGQAVCNYMVQAGFHQKEYITIGIPDEFVEHGDPAILKEKLSLTEDCIVTKIRNSLGN